MFSFVKDPEKEIIKYNVQRKFLQRHPVLKGSPMLSGKVGDSVIIASYCSDIARAHEKVGLEDYVRLSDAKRVLRLWPKLGSDNEMVATSCIGPSGRSVVTDFGIVANLAEGKLTIHAQPRGRVV